MVDAKHFQRVFKRLEKIKNIKAFDLILKSKSIKINNKTYPNLLNLVQILHSFEQKIRFFSLKNLVMCMEFYTFKIC
ncbi:hypothetical protein CGP82_04455 [Campylobacter sp. LR185c]|nr:hypothetical protein CGP82_04455 [Campylobacter sp. LR185c]